jgi:hypothetical protein
VSSDQLEALGLHISSQKPSAVLRAEPKTHPQIPEKEIVDVPDMQIEIVRNRVDSFAFNSIPPAYALPTCVCGFFFFFFAC